MVCKLKSKQEIRQEMEQAICQYLSTGGKINKVDSGISGYEVNQNLNKTVSFTPANPQTRTLLTDTVKLIDQRKQKKKNNSPPKKTPKKRIICDDFGEPVREVWE